MVVNHVLHGSGAYIEHETWVRVVASSWICCSGAYLRSGALSNLCGVDFV